MKYPTTFSETLTPLDAAELDQPGVEALERLTAGGFEVVAGITPTEVDDIARIAHQDPIREFCPKDETTRFKDVPTMERWFAGREGRGMFLLRRLGGGAVTGYGWTGPEKCEQLPDCETTFAIRLDEKVGGRGLGTPFTTAIISGSMALFGATRIGLETWQSNAAAVRTYEKAGAKLMGGEAGVRPTLDPQWSEQGGEKPDVRLFMQFPRTFPA